MRVEFAYANRAREVVMGLEVRPGSTVLECAECSGLFQLVPVLRDAEVGFAVFGRRVEPAAPVSKGDRIEVLRPLEIDPNEARRLRAVQGDRGAETIFERDPGTQHRGDVLVVRRGNPLEQHLQLRGGQVRQPRHT